MISHIISRVQESIAKKRKTNATSKANNLKNNLKSDNRRTYRIIDLDFDQLSKFVDECERVIKEVFVPLNMAVVGTRKKALGDGDPNQYVRNETAFEEVKRGYEQRIEQYLDATEKIKNLYEELDLSQTILTVTPDAIDVNLEEYANNCIEIYDKCSQTYDFLAPRFQEIYNAANTVERIVKETDTMIKSGKSGVGKNLMEYTKDENEINRLFVKDAGACAAMLNKICICVDKIIIILENALHRLDHNDKNT